MERKLGTLSYNPKTLMPMYHGAGPNRFYEFMQSKIRQNIAEACYNDSLTPEGISLETGIPLPYLDSEISSLVEKEILIKDRDHYKTNVIILTAECTDQVIRSAAPCHKKIADLVEEFLDTGLASFKKIGFAGSDFTDNTLRWQLTTFFLRESAIVNMQDTEAPRTAWGEPAFLWLMEQGSALDNNLFSFCTISSLREDTLYFVDYRPAPKGDHRDLYGNDHAINLLCSIAHGDCAGLSEYDLETVAELIRKGYVLKKDGSYVVTMPLFTPEQYFYACKLAKEFVSEKLKIIIEEISQLSAGIICEHTPGYLQNQVAAISNRFRLVNVGYIPLSILIEKNVLSTCWTPGEMPGMQIKLHP